LLKKSKLVNETGENFMAKLFFDGDADLNYLQGLTMGFIGYGNQGRAQALNLRDSGVNVIVGSGTEWSVEMARDDGFPVHSLKEIAKRAHILFMLLPDEVMPEYYEREIAPYLHEGQVLNFASGYNIHFKFICPPPFVDVTLVAPRMIGKGVRDTFIRGVGFPSLIAVHQDFSGKALERTLAIAKGIGSTRMGVVLSSFEEEAVVDLFTEQSGDVYFPRVMFDVLTEAGYSSEAVLLELYASGELSEMYAAARDLGMYNQLRLHSRTSQYGQQVTSLKFLNMDAMRNSLRKVIGHIKSGEFAKEWHKEYEQGLPNLIKKTNENLQDPMQQAENRLYRLLGRRKKDIDRADWLTETDHKS
jgi:ketol-acid reductoisomerase